ncbi:MAG: DNA polymerase I [Geminicoccaceae bacterium]|nr:MAG: DNA polymerase I [Geminicoccaceae bacterium]
MTDTAPRLLLVDGSGYIFRAFFALPPMTRPDGTPVNAVYGFCNMLWRLMQDRPNDHILVVFDASGESFRNEIYDQYKANREEAPEDLKPQMAIVREAVDAFGLPHIEQIGFEADDLIATYARLAKAAGEPVQIVSSDKDLMQLIGPGVTMWDPMKNRDVDDAVVKDRFHVTPDKVRDVLALAGDSSDNVPGVPGIGAKTAAQLLEQFGDLETLLANAPSIKQPKRRQTLIDFADQARLSQKLVTLKDDVPVELPLDALKRPAFDSAKAKAFLDVNDFKSLKNRIDQAVGEAAATIEAIAGEIETVLIQDLEALEGWLAAADRAGVLALDVETTSLNVAAAELVGVSLAIEPGKGAYLPLQHKDEFGHLVAGQVDLEEALARLRAPLAEGAILKVLHNAKYDLAVLARYGLPVQPIDDTMLLSYVLDGAAHGHGMDELARRHLQHETIPFEAVCGKGKSQITFDQAPIEKAAAYAAEDAEVTLRLWRQLKARLVHEHQVGVYETLERPLPPIIAAMETAGVLVDTDILKRLTADFTQRMAQLEDEATKLAGRPFNLGSPKQLGEVLFDELGLGGSGKKTKTGSHATGAEVLEELAAQGHELPRVVLDWRQLQKLTRTYTEALVDEVQPTTGRIHTSYMLASTSTGRLSSTDPNLQNIPIRTEEGRKIRTAFIAADGHALVSADYSQVELRILAHIADIGPLKDAFANDVDIHSVTAAEMFDVPVDQVSGELRRRAKTINYGIIYGIGAWGLATRLGIDQADAKAFIARYFERYPGIKAYMDRVKDEARTHGAVRTLFGRRCVIPEINTKVVARRAYAERQAINAPIQGSAADIMKRAMIRVDRRLRQDESKARLLLQVHDELVLEVPKDEVVATTDLLRHEMANAAALSVPLVVDVGHGTNWDAAH